MLRVVGQPTFPPVITNLQLRRIRFAAGKLTYILNTQKDTFVLNFCWKKTHEGFSYLPKCIWISKQCKLHTTALIKWQYNSLLPKTTWNITYGTALWNAILLPFPGHWRRWYILLHHHKDKRHFTSLRSEKVCGVFFFFLLVLNLLPLTLKRLLKLDGFFSFLASVKKKHV